MEINLNQVPQGSTVYTNSNYSPKKTVNKIIPSCDCMTAKYDEKHKIIRLSYKANKLSPQVLENQGYQEIYKFLTIHFNDGNTERINIKGKIIQ